MTTHLPHPGHCIACAASPRRTLRLLNGRRLLRCPECGLGWWEWPAFDPAQLYSETYFQSSASDRGYDDYASLEPGLRRTARARLNRIRSLVPHAAGRPARLLDIGCGTGVFLDEAARAGWNVDGLEVSDYASSVARRRNLRVRTGAIEELQLPAASYDCVTLWDVIEHLRDPAGVLARAASALRLGGVLALSTGDVTSLCARVSGPRWHLFSLPEHLFFFSPASLRILLEQSGLAVARVAREVYWAPVQYLGERLAKMFGQPVLGHLPLQRCLLPATLCDVLGVYAVRWPSPARAEI